MLKYLMKKHALSKKGAYDFVKATASCVFVDLIIMLSAYIVFKLVEDLYYKNNINYVFYIVLSTIIILLIYISNYFKYNLTFFATYKKSENRRLMLAEILRKLPLSYFEKKMLQI